MKNYAEFQILGHVGRITPFDSATRVTVCANYRRKDDRGNWEDDAHWNEVVIFSQRTRNYIAEHVKTGDLVHVRGRIRQNRFKDRNTGEVRYTVDLIATHFGRLASKQVDGDDD